MTHQPTSQYVETALGRVGLAPVELRIVSCLSWEPVTAREIEKRVWTRPVGYRSLGAYLHRIRAKLKPIGVEIVYGKNPNTARGYWLAGSPILDVVKDGVPRTYNARTVRGPHGRVKLTAREIRLLAVLVKANGEPLTVPDLKPRVWPDRATSRATVYATLSRLRHKLGPLGFRLVSPPHTGAWRYGGYRLEAA